MNRQQYLDLLLQRSKLLQGATCERVSKALTAMKTGLSPETDKKVLDLIRAAQAQGKGSAPALQLATMRVETVDNFIYGSSNALTFFDSVDLALTDEPFIENTSKTEIRVDYIGQDGRPKKTSAVRHQEQARVDLHTLSTEEFEYFVMDMYKGDVRTPQLASVDMGYELMMQVDGLLWPYIQGRVSATPFNFTTGTRSSRVFVPHSRIDTANLPTINLLTPSGNSATTQWRKACMDLVLRYVSAWGSNAFRDGPLVPVTVFIPSKHVMGLLDEITVLADSMPNSKVEEILETGFILQYGGVRWSFVGDSTLSPVKGRAYVKMNKGIGTFFTKKALDKVLVDNSIELLKQNKESVSMTKVIGVALPSQKIVNIVAVQYKTDET